MPTTAMERAKTLIVATITELDKIPHDECLSVHRAPAAPHNPQKEWSSKKGIMYQLLHPKYPPQRAAAKSMQGWLQTYLNLTFSGIRERNGERVEDVVCMTWVTLQQHVREHSNNSKTVSSNDQGAGREGADVEMQQQNMGLVSFLE
jgi:hypothetical protein